MMLRKSMIAAALLASASGAVAGPAVTNTNLKFTALGGSAETASSSDTAWAAIGALTAPLGQKWGIQLEAGAGGIDGDTGYGAAGHVFTRDPDNYLLGAFVSYANIDDAGLSATRFGAEAELYFDKITLLAAAGYQYSDDLGDSPFAGAELRLYATDDLALSLGGAAMEDAAFARLGAEWRIAPEAMPGVALRADAAIGDDDYSSVMGGLTVYFGEDATLKSRHRAQDPNSALFDQFQGMQALGGGQDSVGPIQCIVSCNSNS